MYKRLDGLDVRAIKDTLDLHIVFLARFILFYFSIICRSIK